MSAAITIGKIVTVGVWLYGIAAYVVPDAIAYAMWARWLIAILAVAHALEALIFAPRLQRMDGRSRSYHVWSLMAFGLFHTLSVKARHAAPAL